MSERVTDVVLQAGSIDFPDRTPIERPRHFNEPVQLTDDLWIGPRVDREAIMDACEPCGENRPRATRQYGSLYAFFRTNAPTDRGRWQFDPDRRLGRCLQLSRIVRPTSIGYEYSGRVFEGEERREISPSGIKDAGVHAYVADESQNWIRDQDVTALTALLAQFDPERLPERVKRAMFYHERLSWEKLVDIRWPLCVTALEALIHTRDVGRAHMRSTDQFVVRLAMLRQFVPGLSWTEGDLRAMYALRSGYAHGAGIRSVDAIRGEPRRLYLLAENGLRTIIRACIESLTRAGLFDSDGSIRIALGDANART